MSDANTLHRESWQDVTMTIGNPTAALATGHNSPPGLEGRLHDCRQSRGGTKLLRLREI
jgi:hypothetical protein